MMDIRRETTGLAGFPGTSVQREIFDTASETLSAAEQAVLDAFQALGTAPFQEAERHLIAYARQICTMGGWDDIDMTEPSDETLIWDHVRLRFLVIEEDYSGPLFLELRGGCDWEPDYGVALSWREGTVLTRVGPSTGHFTNPGYGKDPAMDDVIFFDSQNRFTTRRNG